MNFKEILSAIKDGGVEAVLLAILFAIGIFFWRAGWPWLKEQARLSRADHREETASFLKALERRDKEFGKIVQGLDRLGSKIEAKRATRKPR